MPEKPGKEVPKLMADIADAIEKGMPISKVSELYKYKPEVITKIYQFVKDGQGADDPVIQKVIASSGGNQTKATQQAQQPKQPAEALLMPIANDIKKGMDVNEIANKHGIRPEEVFKIEDYFNKKIGDDNPVIQSLLRRKAPKQIPQPESDQQQTPADAANTEQPKSYKYVKDGREKWADFAELPVVNDGGRPMKEIIMEVAQKHNINPEILYTSAMEEGMGQAAKSGKEFNFPAIDGFGFFGLDDLDKFGVEEKYTPVQRTNEQGRVVNSGVFNSVADALSAKARAFNYFKGKVNKFLERNNIKDASPDAIDFLTMQAYNAGDGVLPKYLNKYKKEGLWQDAKFLEQDPSGEYIDNQSYVHSRRRYDPARMIRDKGTFKAKAQQTAPAP